MAVSNLSASLKLPGKYDTKEAAYIKRLARASAGIIAVQTADSAVNNTTTYASSTELIVKGLGGKGAQRYFIDGTFYLTNDTVTDAARIRLNLSGTGNASAACNLLTTAIGNTTVTTVRNYAFSSNVAEIAVVADATTGVSVQVSGIIYVAALGDLVVQYAEEVASAGTGAVLKANSYISVRALEF